MFLAYSRKTSQERLDAVTLIDEGCGRAISVCIDMMDAAHAIGAYERLCEVRDALINLHIAAEAMRKDIDGIRDKG